MILSIDNKKIIRYSNRGMSLECLINDANIFYNENNIALIYKKPTPIKILDFDDNKNIITKACFDKKSTTDYNGVYKGKYIDFEAKSTKSKTSFPLSNIQEWQDRHLRKVIMHGGIAFLIIEFSSLNKYYVINYLKIINKTTNKNSLKIEYLKNEGYEIIPSLNPILNYIKIIDYFL